MRRAAEANAESDRQKRELIEQRNHAEAMVHQVEKTLRENEGKVGAQEKGEAEAALAAARSALEGTDGEALKQATERLSQSAMKIGEAMYRGSQEEAASGAGAGTAGHDAGHQPDDKVIDAEFEDVDDKKKHGG